MRYHKVTATRIMKIFSHESFFDNSHCNRRCFFCSVMSTNEVMYHPTDIQCSLQRDSSFFAYVSGLPAVSGATTTNRTVECLTLVGMHVFIRKILNLLWMLRSWRFILANLFNHKIEPLLSITISKGNDRFD